MNISIDRLAPERTTADPYVIEANGTPWMLPADQLILDGYLPYAPPDSDPRDLESHQRRLRLLRADPYESLGRSFTFVVVLPDPECRTSHLAAGTLRLMISGEDTATPHLAPIPAMHMFEVDPAWPHRQAGQPDAMVAELGRFVIARRFRSAAVTLLSALLGSALARAGALAVRTIYAVTLPKVDRILQQTPYPLHEVAGATLLDTAEVQVLSRSFPGYWEHDPALYARCLDPPVTGGALKLMSCGPQRRRLDIDRR